MELQPLRQVTPLGVPALPRLQLAINPQTNARVRLYVWNPAIHGNPVSLTAHYIIMRSNCIRSK